MKILLIGGLGFIGKHIIRALAGSSSLTVFSDAEAAHKNQAFVNAYNVHIEGGDITDRERVNQVILAERPDAVVHLAPLTGIAKCNRQPTRCPR